MTPSVTAIVLNWNNAPDTIACLASLAQQDYPHRVLVVDNGSMDDSVARIAATFPAVEILQTGANLGYAGGNNAGIRRALQDGAEYVFVLNNDVALAPDCLSALVGVAESADKVCFAGPKVYQREPPGFIQSAGMVSPRAGEWRLRGLGELDTGQYEATEEIDVLSGCALLASADALARVGLLDERFYLYDEDIDWCLRAREAGYRNVYAPSARIWHRNHEQRTADMPRMTYYINRNRHLLYRKHHLGVLAQTRLAVQQAVWVVNWTLNPKWRGKRRDRDALCTAMLDAALGRYDRGTFRDV